jgi:hypothetical protein
MATFGTGYARLRAVVCGLALAGGLALVACGSEEAPVAGGGLPTEASVDAGALAQAMLDGGFADDQRSASCAADELVKTLSAQEVQSAVDGAAGRRAARRSGSRTALEDRLSAAARGCSLTQ